VINSQKIVQNAIGRLTAATGWNVDYEGDTLHLKADGYTYAWNLLIRNGLRNIHLPAIEKELADKQPTLLVTDYLLPSLRERLRINGLSYLDGAGNIFLKGKGVLILVEAGGRKKQENRAKTGNRAFTKTGLPLVFDILQNQEVLKKTRRELAQIYEMAVGNVHNVLEGLQEDGYLVARGTTRKRQYRLINKRRLLDAWIKEYGEQLKPELFIGSYRFLQQEGLGNWKKLPLHKDQTVWGSEPASSLLTNYLSPGELTMYTEETVPDILKTYRVVPEKDGLIKVYRKFWHYEGERMQGIAPVLLVYADLLLTGYGRCAETAAMIYDEYLSKEF